MIKKVLLKPYIFLAVLMTAIYLIDTLTGRSLTNLGSITPRMFSKIQGILTYSFLHGSWGHLVSNMGPFLLIGFFLRKLMTEGEFWFMWFALTIMSGLCVWIFGAPNSYHVGASGVIFGMWSLVLTIALKRKEFKDILIGLIVGLFYGLTFIYGLIPQKGISFAGHFYGLISGIIFGIGFINYKNYNLNEKK